MSSSKNNNSDEEVEEFDDDFEDEFEDDFEDLPANLSSTMNSLLNAKGDMKELVEKILELEPNKRQQLLSLIDTFKDTENIALSSSTKDKSLSNNINLIQQSLSRISAPIKQRITSSNELKIRLISNYNDFKNEIGLSGIEIYDNKFQLIDIKSNDISLKCSNNKIQLNHKNLCHLINGINNTTKDQYMWKCNFDNKNPIDIIFFISPTIDIPLSRIVIWNYNHSLEMSGICVRDCEIYYNNELIWKGIIDKGTGLQNYNFSTIIPLQKSLEEEEPPVTARIMTANNNNNNNNNKSPIDSKMNDTLSFENSTSIQYSTPPSTGQTKSKTNNNNNNNNNNAVKDVEIKPLKGFPLRPSSSSPSPSPQPSQPLKAQPKDNTVTSSTSTVNKKQEEMKIDVNSPALPSFTINNETLTSNLSSSDFHKTPWSISPNKRKKRASIRLRTPQTNQTSDPILDDNNSNNSSKITSKPSLSLASSSSTSSSSQNVNNNNISSIPNNPFQLKVPLVSPHPTAANKNATTTTSHNNNNNNNNVPKLKNNSNLDSITEERLTPLPDYSKILAERKVKQTDEDLDKTFQSLHNFNMTNRSRLMPQNDSPPPTEEQTPSKTDITSPSPSQSSSSLSMTNKDNTVLFRMSNSLDRDILSYFANPLNQQQIYQHQSSQPTTTTTTTTNTNTNINSYSNVNNTNYDSSNFLKIPILPLTKNIKFILSETWGDMNYIGLNGIQIYNDKGELIEFNNPKRNIKAVPSDINVLCDYGHDPRVVTNLLDNINFTSDDLHIWLAPYNPGKENYITITLDKPTKISMIRIWNYNKSRTHSYRGVRNCKIYINDEEKLIFEGEIRKAPGIMSNIEECSEIILFTVDENILTKLEMNDTALLESEDITYSFRKEALQQFEENRPLTAEGHNLSRKKDVGKNGNNNYGNNSSMQLPPKNINLSANGIYTKDGRPMTSVSNTLLFNKKQTTPSQLLKQASDLFEIPEEDDDSGLKSKNNNNIQQQQSKPNIMNNNKSLKALHDYNGNKLTLELLENWGDYEYIGLTGISFLVGDNMNPIAVNKSQLRYDESNELSSYMNNYKSTIDNILNGENITCDERNMWLTNYQKNKTIKIDVELDKSEKLTGLKIWNYNKNDEDVIRGVRRMHVYINNNRISPPSGYYIRESLGLDKYDYSQVIYFGMKYNAIPKSVELYGRVKTVQDYDSLVYPFGSLLRICLNNSLGDPYYIGLSEIEVYDVFNNRIQIEPKQIYSDPEDINILNSDIDRDNRVVQNLIDGNINDDSRSWLCPLASTLDNYVGRNNKIFICFDKPIIISYIKIWNYKKNNNRGAKDIEIWLDNSLIYKGWLKDRIITGDKGQTILFTNDEKILSTEKCNVYPPNENEQSVVLIDEKRVLSCGAKLDTTSYNLKDRPTTSMPLNH